MGQFCSKLSTSQYLEPFMFNKKPVCTLDVYKRQIKGFRDGVAVSIISALLQAASRSENGIQETFARSCSSCRCSLQMCIRDSAYIPYAILNWINPVVSVFFGYAGITMTKMTDEEYEKILEEREKEKAEALAALEA